MTYLKNQLIYLDRYGIVPAPAPQPEGDAEYSADFFDEDAFTDQAPADHEQQYRLLEQGSAGDADTDYLAELNQFNDQEAFENQGIDLDTAKQQLGVLQTEIEQTKLPAALKKEWQKKITDASQRLASGGMEDLSEIEDLQAEFKGVVEENPPIPAQISQSLSEAGIEASPATIEQAMKKFGFTDESILKAPLISDTEQSARLMNFLKEIDPSLAQSLAEDSEQGYGSKALGELRSHLDAILPSGTNLELAIQLVDATAQGEWDNEALKKSITGDKIHYDGDYNNRFYDVDKFVDNLKTLASGGSFDLSNYLSAGWNSVDNGPRNKGLEIRRFLTGLYEISGHNPYLMRHFLKQIPESCLFAMKDVLDYRGSGCNANDTRYMGDRWDTMESSSVLNWAINGGSLPQEFKSDENQALEGSLAAEQG